MVWGDPCDEARVEAVLSEGLPGALDYLEGEAPADGFLFGEIGLADIGVGDLLPQRGLCRFRDRRRALAARPPAGSPERSPMIASTAS